ncbi:hypothetical protein TorRG33x02_221190 [Trema orientale]|uniref:Uncharacterized protein n=1 Tax=Trema orientale TaxID=63057 RepID=A0A2P5E9E0_TREOI|nr:hypothetical protein TorRG33x02_221190 [Trema orientale]
MLESDCLSSGAYKYNFEAKIFLGHVGCPQKKLKVVHFSDICRLNAGKDMKASNDPLGSSQETLNSQGPVLMIDQETDHHDDQQNIDETRRLLEAAKEIVSLMHKDYKGMGRRKPPINNHEPSH